jgi:plastocyanin
MASEDDSLVEGFWGTGMAAPGGADEEVVTFDLQPGTYGLVCFVPSADGTPHAMLGMATQITVS